MSRILVTGGAGYVGSVMVPMLLQAGHQVRVLDSLRKGGIGVVTLSADQHFEFVRGELRDEALLARALEGIETIIHLAAIVGLPACQKDPWLARSINVEGTQLLDRLRSKDQLVLFASSLSNYGTATGGLCTEEMTPTPITDYGEAKLVAERHLLASGNVVVFRPATAFGLSPQMRLDLLLNDFVYRAVRHRHLVVYEPEFMRAFIHVRDFARAFLFALEHRHAMRDQLYNLGDESLNVTKGELVRRIRAQVEFVVEWSQNGHDPDQRNYTVDFSKLRKAGFTVTQSIDDGIRELRCAAPLLDVFNPYSNASY